MSVVPRPRSSPPGPGLESGTRELVSRWQELTLRANLGFEANHLVEARRYHLEALAIAEELLDRAVLGASDAGRCGPLLFGTSCNSIVALARNENDAEMEGISLYRIVERFIGLAHAAHAPLGFRSRCLLHLRVASDALYRYFEGRGMWDAAATYSRRANGAMFEVRRHEAAALERARRARAALHVGAPEVAAQVGSIRIEVAGASPRDAAAPRRAGVEPDDVQRVLDASAAE
jgi:hypothetical protein